MHSSHPSHASRKSGDFTLSYVGDFEFQILEKLGGGPTSKIYLVQPFQNGAARCVLKAIKRDVQRDELQFIYQNEIETLQRLAPHPHIITLLKPLGPTTLNQGHYSKNVLGMLLEFAELGSLKDILDRRLDGFSERTARFFFRQMVLALAHMQKQELFHADIKVDNFVVTDPQKLTLKLIDFGLCRKDSDQQDFYDGSLECQCPQIVLRERYSGKQADVFALGVSLLYLLQNQYPWHKVGIYDYSYQHIVSGEFTEFWNKQYLLRKDLSPECKDLIQKMLALKDRPTAEQILAHEWLAIDESERMQEELLQSVRTEIFEEAGCAEEGNQAVRGGKSSIYCRLKRKNTL